MIMGGKELELSYTVECLSWTLFEALETASTCEQKILAVMGDFHLNAVIKRLSEIYQQKRLSGLTHKNFERSKLSSSYLDYARFLKDAWAPEKQAILEIIMGNTESQIQERLDLFEKNYDLDNSQIQRYSLAYQKYTKRFMYDNWEPPYINTNNYDFSNCIGVHAVFGTPPPKMSKKREMQIKNSIKYKGESWQEKMAEKDYNKKRDKVSSRDFDFKKYAEETIKTVQDSNKLTSSFKLTSNKIKARIKNRKTSKKDKKL